MLHHFSRQLGGSRPGTNAAILAHLPFSLVLFSTCAVFAARLVSRAELFLSITIRFSAGRLS